MLGGTWGCFKHVFSSEEVVWVAWGWCLQNLARTVDEDDILWLFGHSFTSYEECLSLLHVRLMQVRGVIFVDLL